MSIERSLELAAAVQRALLPTTCPLCRCATMHVRWIPHESVGGDFYDLPAVADRYRGIVIGDAVGHGLPAAILMALIAGTVHGFAPFEHQPLDLVDRVNHMLTEHVGQPPDQPVPFLASLFYGLADPDQRLFRYVNAGHPPPLLLRRQENRIERLAATGTLVGIAADISFLQRQIRYARGDRLVLLTDGITEARNGQGELFGLDRVEAIATAQAAGPPAACVDAILQGVEAFRDGRPGDDDQTVLVLDFL